jgi:cation transport ATPase
MLNLIRTCSGCIHRQTADTRKIAGGRQQTADSRQQAADSRQQTVDSRHKTADSSQQPAASRQQTADSRQRQQTAASSQQTAASSQQTADSRRATVVSMMWLALLWISSLTNMLLMLSLLFFFIYYSPTNLKQFTRYSHDIFLLLSQLLMYDRGLHDVVGLALDLLVDEELEVIDLLVHLGETVQHLSWGW